MTRAGAKTACKTRRGTAVVIVVREAGRVQLFHEPADVERALPTARPLSLV